jgi:hypothetical protein
MPLVRTRSEVPRLHKTNSSSVMVNKTHNAQLIYMTEFEVKSPLHVAPSEPAGGGAVGIDIGGSGAPGSCRPAARARARIEAAIAHREDNIRQHKF